MTNIAATFKSEMERIARKVLKADADGLRKQSTRHRASIASLKREIEALRREVKRLAKGNDARPSADAEDEDQPLPRFSATRLAAHRAKLGLSAAAYGSLVGVSGQSIYKWEQGSVRPRAAQLRSLASIRGLSKREAQERVAG
ncbi:helix-turn-helix domain-containing protein [Caenimonas sedimenti]|uniref:Helix-turn-helix domain-containing protein n=1 Tax=Caenimonas sedimenti TaxID=2596921 RepID=A0A562ZS74_9BURK|nr:helix-turn-helix transcriptional regulator [Caenimonas sedimenti]TWO71442.1 helix-turn-helix domain-containing protein [Caenimonas sedimenti]